MLVTLREVLTEAQKNHYAVGLFNTVNLEMAKGVLAAAEEAGSPVIIGTAEVLLPFAELRELSSFLLPMAKAARVPVVLHYDHGLTENRIKEALSLGFTSVMYDCSTDSYEGNIQKVLGMVQYAKGFGASVEAELGHVGANVGSAEGTSHDTSIYTEPEQARDFVEKTGADALAVAIGTAHGAYKETPKLDIGRLKEIRLATEAALVLHGGSGLSAEDFRGCVASGISKVNIFTDINCACLKAAVSGYKQGMGMTDVMNAMVQAVKEETLKKMTLFGSVGRV